MAVKKFTISRNDDIYECFPHLCRTKTGRLILTYRESNGHVASQFCRLVIRLSDDSGNSWSDRVVLADEDRSSGILTTWNCPKVQQLADGRIVLLCDKNLYPPGEWGDGEKNCHVFLWYSHDDGETWSESQPTPVKGLCPDQITEMPDGRWLLPTNVTSKTTGNCIQNITVSRDCGRSWEEPVTVFDAPEYSLSEGSIVKCPGGELVFYLREESRVLRPLQKMISFDDGCTWKGPYDTLNPAAQGMPIAGLTQDGLMMTTGRFCYSSTWRIDMTPATWEKRFKRRTIVVPRVPETEEFVARLPRSPALMLTPSEAIMGTGGTSVHTFAFIEPMESVLAPDVGDQKGLLLPLDLDASNLGADSGYTGWVEYDNGKFLVVNYINDDAPLAQIRGYRFSIEDF